MDLTLNSEQRQLVTTARQFVEKTFDIQEQGTATNGSAPTREIFAKFGELGWAGLALTEDIGGAGGSLLELAYVLEELGRGGVPSPLISSVVAARTLIAAGGTERYRDLLEGIAEGTAIATVALISPGAGDEWSSSVTGEKADGGWILDGELILVPYGDEADALLTIVDLDGAPSWIVIPGDTVHTSRHRVIGGEPKSAVRLDRVRIDTDSVLPALGESPRDDVIDLAAILHSAYAVGACEAALQLSVTWAKDREQFGRPIGSFQAVSNRCADMRLAIDAARLLTWEAAWALDEGRDTVTEFAAVAKSYLSAAAEVVVTNAHQVHGAIGFSTEYPLHVFTRLIRAYQTSWGTPRAHLERVADALGL